MMPKSWYRLQSSMIILLLMGRFMLNFSMKVFQILQWSHPSMTKSTLAFMKNSLSILPFHLLFLDCLLYEIVPDDGDISLGSSLEDDISRLEITQVKDA